MIVFCSRSNASVKLTAVAGSFVRHFLCSCFSFLWTVGFSGVSKCDRRSVLKRFYTAWAFRVQSYQLYCVRNALDLARDRKCRVQNLDFVCARPGGSRRVQNFAFATSGARANLVVPCAIIAHCLVNLQIGKGYYKRQSYMRPPPS